MMEINIFQELFLSTEIWGYLGPLALVACGLFLVQREKVLFIFVLIVEWLFAYHYLELIATTPGYAWHAVILLLGSLFTLVYPLWDR